MRGKQVYLAAMEKEQCVQYMREDEYDFENVTEALHVGHSPQNGEAWYEEIQKCQGGTHVRLGIFLCEGTLVGDVALQDIDKWNRSCTLGCGLTKLAYRGKGYATDAVRTILAYGFDNLGLERISASTVQHNIGARRSLEKCGFRQEGILRGASYFAGKRHDKILYGLLREEWAEALRG